MARTKKPLVFRDRNTKEKIPFYVKTEDVELPDGTDIGTKIDEIEEALEGAADGTVKSVTLNNVTVEPDANGVVDLGTVITSHQSLAALFGKVAYDGTTHRINFYGKDDVSMTTVLGYIDCSPFIVDGMLSNVDVKNVTINNVSTLCMVFSFNTDAGKQNINIPVSSIFNAANYYTKGEVDDALDGKVDKEDGKSLMTDAERTKLQGLPTNPVTSITVNGQTKTPTNGNVNIEVQGGAQGQKGDKGDTVVVGGEQEFTIVNDTTTGGASDALSAEMGKRVAGREATDRQRIDAIVAILKKSVFTDDQADAFAALDALANGIDSISFNASSHKFTGVGDTFTLSIITDPAGKTTQVTWATDNASVATVNNGVVTAVADGAATITATTTDGKVAVCKIEVATIVITGLSLNKSTLTLNGNDANETLVATTTPAGYESSVQWSSSDPTKATVDNNGKVTAVGNGSAVITASINGLTATCQVTVTGVMQTFHIAVDVDGASVTSGGNPVSDGTAVVEGSSLELAFAANPTFELTSVSVDMEGVAQTVVMAQDKKSASVSIQSVTGDITVKATAEYVPENLFKDEYKVTGYAIPYNEGAKFKEASGYDSYIVPVQFGKRYKVICNIWADKSWNHGLLKSDGNGGYTSLLFTDITSAAFAQNNNEFSAATYVSQEPSGNKTIKEFTFVTPSASEVQGIEQLYFCITYNRYYSGENHDKSANMRMYEMQIVDSYGADAMIDGIGFIYSNYNFGKDGAYTCAVFKAEKGATYSYSGYGTNSSASGFIIGLLKSYGNTMLFNQMNGNDIAAGSQWGTNDTFFNHSGFIISKDKTTPDSGTFTVPSAADLDASVGDIYIAINTRFSSTDKSANITFTKQSQS